MFSEINKYWKSRCGRYNKNYKSYKKKGEKLDFKVIYGVEAYLVDDTRKIVINPAGQDFKGEFVVFDLNVAFLLIQFAHS